MRPEMTLQGLKDHYAAVRSRLNTPHIRVVEIEEETPEPVVVPIVTAPFKPYLIPRATPKMEDILEIVCEFYEVRYVDVISERRNTPIVRPRQVAMYLGRKLTTYGTPRIGKEMGGRDHTTIIYGARRIESDSMTDERLRDELQLLEIKINERVAARNGEA